MVGACFFGRAPTAVVSSIEHGSPGTRDTEQAVSDNLELACSIIASGERGDMMPDEWSQNAHPEIDLVVVDGPEPSSHAGPADAGPSVEAFLDLWDDYRVEAEEYGELDDKRVLVLTRQSGRPDPSPRSTLACLITAIES